MERNREQITDVGERRSAEAFRLPECTHISKIHLRVSDLKASVGFYTKLVGFRVRQQTRESALLVGLADHRSMVELTYSPNAPSRPPRIAGLYHVAFRYPNRRELSTALWRFLQAAHPVSGTADHLVSDAIYLSDPDGNGVELSCDQPSQAWPRHAGKIEMGTEPFDVDALLAVTDGSADGGAEVDVEIGHVHLQVTNLNRSEGFYCGLLGFDVTQRSLPGALFLSAGGYHHHVGMNVWATGRGLPADETHLGMISFSVRLGDRKAFEALRSRIAQSAEVNFSARDAEKDSFLVHDPDRIGIVIVP